MVDWIDTHCHLDAAEFAGAQTQVRARAAQRGVVHCVIPAVNVDNFDAVQALAHVGGDSYALGIHPLCVPQARDDDLQRLAQALAARRDDPRLVAVGEIGLDFFVPALCTPQPMGPGATAPASPMHLPVASNRRWPFWTWVSSWVLAAR